MNPPTADRLELPALAPDPSIERALGDLRSKLAVWSAAMERAQTHLERGTAVLDRSQEPAGLPQPQPATDVPRDVAADAQPPAASADEPPAASAALLKRAAREPEPETEPADVPPIRTPRISSAAARDVASRQDESPPGSDKKTETGPKKLVLKKGRGISPGPAAPPAAPSGPPSAPEDEALLAQLPPEVAAAIRVKRRLAGNKRSVADLVREYQEGSGHARSGDGAGWSWWSRGKK